MGGTSGCCCSGCCTPRPPPLPTKHLLHPPHTCTHSHTHAAHVKLRCASTLASSCLPSDKSYHRPPPGSTTRTLVAPSSSTGATSMEGPGRAGGAGGGGEGAGRGQTRACVCHTRQRSKARAAGAPSLPPHTPTLTPTLTPTHTHAHAPLTQHERVLLIKGCWVRGELVPKGAHDRGAGGVGVEEEGVDVGKQAVAACARVCVWGWK